MRVVRIGYRLTDIDSLDTGNRENVSRPADRLVYALQAFKRIQFRDFCSLKSAVQFDDPNLVPKIKGAVENPRDRQPAQVFAVIEICDEHLQWPCSVARRIGNTFQNSLEQRPQVR